MKERINLSKVNPFELQKNTLNSIRAGEAGICNFSCGCSCACQTGDQYAMNNTADANAVTTESGSAVGEATNHIVALILSKL